MYVGAAKEMADRCGLSLIEAKVILVWLERQGLVRKTKDTKRGRTGRPAVVWKFPARGEFCLVPEHQRTA